MPCLKPIVINGHGAKTDQRFQIHGHTLLTPENLSVPYIFSIAPNYSIEKDIQQYKVKNVREGHWTLYHKSISPTVNDVLIAPWQANELKTFAHDILNNPSHWANIDNQHQYYLSKDPNAVLVVKKGLDYLYLSQQTAINFLTKVDNGHYSKAQDGTPLFFYADKIGKVKILGHTSLSEVLEQIEKCAGPKLVMLATCNAGERNKIVGYDTFSTEQDVVKLAETKGIDLFRSIPTHENYAHYIKENFSTDFGNKLTFKNSVQDPFDNQHFTYGPLNKSLFTQELELLTKCVLKNSHQIHFYAEKNDLIGKTEYHAKVGDMDINVSSLMKKANFSHIQLEGENLSNLEKNSITAYTGNEYMNINNFLWGKETYLSTTLNDIFAKCTLVASGLNKIMPDTKYHSFTYRGDKASDIEISERINLIKQGGGISDTDAFFSTTLNVNTAKAFSGKAVIYFDERYGKNISDLSYFPGEKEYLLEPSTLLWTKHEYKSGLHIFHAKKVVPLIEGKDTPSHDDISKFKQLCIWAKQHGVNTDFITPHLKSVLETHRDDYLDEIKPKTCTTDIRLEDCIQPSHFIPGLDVENQSISISETPSLATPPTHYAMAPLMQEVYPEISL